VGIVFWRKRKPIDDGHHSAPVSGTIGLERKKSFYVRIAEIAGKPAP
jgi:hypothetical protein